MTRRWPWRLATAGLVALLLASVLYIRSLRAALDRAQEERRSARSQVVEFCQLGARDMMSHARIRIRRAPSPTDIHMQISAIGSLVDYCLERSPTKEHLEVLNAALHSPNADERDALLEKIQAMLAHPEPY